MNNNRPYENKRSELEQQASQYMINEFGEDWAVNDLFKKYQNRFFKLYSYDEHSVRKIYREKRAEHSNSAPFLLTLSPIVYNCILLKNNAFKTLVSALSAEIEINNKKTTDEVYQDAIKSGNRFAKKVVLDDPMRFNDGTYELARTCKEPMTYKFKQAEMVGNIM